MKLKLKLLALFAFCVASLLVSLPGVKADDDGDEQSKIARGFAIAPVPLNLKKKNRALVGLGSYIVN